MLVALAALGSAGPADAAVKQVRYVGIHPIPASEGGGICYIEGPHVHIFEASDRLQYRDHRGANYFVGDPVAYGYDGQRYVYRGHHPIHVDAVVGDDVPDDEFCYIDGPHYHSFAPPEGPEFKVSGDAYFYVGDPPRAYVEARPRMVRINAEYQPLVYERPVVTVDPPAGWIGARAEFVTPAVVVEPPRAGVRVEAVAPEPSVRAGVGIGIGVGVAAGIGIGAGTVVRERPVIVHERPVIVHERPVIVHERPVIVHERPVIVHERPVIVRERPVVVRERPVVVHERPVVRERVEVQHKTMVDDRPHAAGHHR